MSKATQVVGHDPQTSGVQSMPAKSVERRMTIAPAVDIFEEKADITVVADLPGVSKDRLAVKVLDGNLVIEAEASVPTPDGLRLQRAEMQVPGYYRALTLSPDLDSAGIEANLQDGVLKLHIPRREEARPRRIDVKAG